MKRLLLAPAIALPFFLVSCGQPGGPSSSGNERPGFPQGDSATVMERWSQNDPTSSKASGSSSYRQQRQADTSTSAS